MIISGRAASALVAGGIGAVFWAYGLAVLQPLCELPGTTPENNTYWARDLRWSAIVAVTGMLIVLAGGNLRRSLAVAAGGVLWIGADMALERVEPAYMPTAVVAVLVVTAAVVALRLRPGPPWRHRRRLLTTAALACLATSSTVMTVSSPTDTEPELAPSRQIVFVLAVVASLACVLAALPASRRWLRGALAVTLWAVYAVAALATPWAAIILFPLIGTISLLTRPWPGPGAAALKVAMYGIAAFFATWVALFVTMLFAPLFTWLAGNEPVQFADTDMVGAFLALVLTALVVAGPVILATIRPARAAAPEPATTAASGPPPAPASGRG